MLKEFQRTRPEDIDPFCLFKGMGVAMYGAVSNDGIHWKVLPDPQLLMYSENLYAGYYDPILERYVLYGRAWWYYGRRCIARYETEDFRRWPSPEMILWPSTDLRPDDDWYTNSKTIYPGTVDHHLMFPALYNRSTDSTELYMFSSPDGIVWSQVPGGPVLSPGPTGSWDGGCVFGGVGLVPLSNDRVGIPYTGNPYPHKYPRNKYTMTPRIAYAWWPKGRLAALEAPEYGNFETVPLVFSGRKLLLNVQTLRAGKVLVEVANMLWETFSGRSFDECDPIIGDYFDIPVTWKGEADLGHETGQPIILRFRMKAAKLFAFEFV